MIQNFGAEIWGGRGERTKVKNLSFQMFCSTGKYMQMEGTSLPYTQTTKPSIYYLIHIKHS
jgi:hypothetical protein